MINKVHSEPLEHEKKQETAFSKNQNQINQKLENEKKDRECLKKAKIALA